MMNKPGNPMMMLNQFIQFKNSFTGDPKQEVERLIASGRMSQGQLNQLQAMAKQFQQIFNIK